MKCYRKSQIFFTHISLLRKFHQYLISAVCRSLLVKNGFIIAGKAHTKHNVCSLMLNDNTKGRLSVFHVGAFILRAPCCRQFAQFSTKLRCTSACKKVLHNGTAAGINAVCVKKKKEKKLKTHLPKQCWQMPMQSCHIAITVSNIHIFIALHNSCF